MRIFIRGSFISSNDLIEVSLNPIENVSPVYVGQVIRAYQNPDGAWSINWDAPTPGSKLEWRGYCTLEALCRLSAYGRLYR